ncbi:uncharacterized protein NPIL_28821 [Nephila pilipes]|uniref:Uncharacterized protein n=1 Tax=Nephila pilipes TaxID=299642 RepID=A0A8X6IAD2_NEPPI|nr:uncharacterized protein NPIL_28821 [Nephila pilipes]
MDPLPIHLLATTLLRHLIFLLPVQIFFLNVPWAVFGHIGSDHFSILIKFSKQQLVVINRDKLWNFRKANWDSFWEAVDTCLVSEPMTVDLTHSYIIVLKTVLEKARSSIPRGNVKHYVPYFAHNTSILSPILEKRKRLLETFSATDNYTRTELSKINAELKLAYAHLKKERRKEMCSKIDSRSSDSKLWKVVKNINKEQEQFATCNSVRDAAGQAYPHDKSAVNGLSTHYQSSSRFNFSSMNRSILKRARNVIHGCRSSDLGDPMLAKPFSSREFLHTLALLDLKNPLDLMVSTAK